MGSETKVRFGGSEIPLSIFLKDQPVILYFNTKPNPMNVAEKICT